MLRAKDPQIYYLLKNAQNLIPDGQNYVKYCQKLIKNAKIDRMSLEIVIV